MGDTIMANADSPDPTKDLLPVANKEDEVDPVAPAGDPKLPTRKDASLKDFLSKMDDYAPIIPDAVTNYYLTKAGLPPPPQTDPRLARLLALATQKFIADIAADAYQYSRIRSSSDQVMEVVDKVAARTGPSLQWKIWGWLLGNTESMLREASSIDERFWDIWEATVWFDLIRDSMGGVQCIMRRSIATEFGNHLIWAEVLNICTTEAC